MIFFPGVKLLLTDHRSVLIFSSAIPVAKKTRVFGVATHHKIATDKKVHFYRYCYETELVLVTICCFIAAQEKRLDLHRSDLQIYSK